MASLVGAHPISTFVSPVNGTSPINADQVRGNDNTIQTAYNAHDTDGTIHIQSSTLAARPAFGTAGRIWFTSDGFRLYYDNGSAWTEAAYLPSAGGTVSGNVLITGTLGVTGVITASTGLTVTTGGLTVSAGTTAVQAITGTSLVLTADITLANGKALFLTRNSGTSPVVFGRYDVGTDDLSTVMGGQNYRWRDTGAGVYMVLNGTTGLTIASGLVVTAGGVTVSAGTTAVQALTATTGVFAGAVSGVTTLAIGGALSGVTTLNASGLATLGAGIALTGSLTAAAVTISTNALTMQASTVIVAAASTSILAGFRLQHGATVTGGSLGDGDMWTTTAGLFVRINGVTKTVTLT